MIRAEPADLEPLARNPTFEIEQRAAERFSLLIRSAKLVAPDGEYLCVIRDVSATGLSIRTFHDLPLRPKMRLVTRTNQVLPLELIWTQDRAAGFRFLSEVDVDQLIEERTSLPKRGLRFECRVSAKADDGKGDAFPLVIENISQQGARISCRKPLAINQPLRIASPQLGEIEAKVRWRSEPEFGVVFEHTYRIDEFARLIHRLHHPSPTASMQAAPSMEVPQTTRTN